MKKTIAVTIATGLVMTALCAALLLWPSEPQALIAEESPGATRAKVSVVTVAPQVHRPVVTTHGEARALHDVQLAAEVTGQVTRLAPGLESGALVDRGELLLEIEATPYRQALALARREVADAELLLLQEEREAEQATRNWERAGLGEPGEAATALLERKPQVAAARAALEAAQASVAQAQLELDRTRVSAPFDAVIVERTVGPGSFVQPGSPLAHLSSRDRVEVRLPLNERQWALLPEAATMLGAGWLVELAGIEHGEGWIGEVDRVERHVDGASRQRALVARVDDPLEQDPPLLAGTFVEARVEGTPREALLRLPASALTASGRVWHVDGDGFLRTFPAEPLFEADGSIYVTPPEGHDGGEMQVLDRPLNSYVEGAPVEVVGLP